MSDNISERLIGEEEHKKILLDLLLELDSFCNKSGIKYYLFAGTLLGAVRHKGFIPWDDDADVCLLRKDYDRLLREFHPSSKRFKLLSLDSDEKYDFPYAKLIDDSTCLIENTPKAIPTGVFIDIFPLDCCPGDSFEKACKTVKKMSFLRTVRNIQTISFDKKRGFFKNCILALGKALTIFSSRRSIAKKINNKAKKYTEYDSLFIGELTNTVYGYGEVFKREYFRDRVEIVFEGHRLSAPIDYAKILKSLYGDYMKLPPEEKRKSTHEFRCWRK